MTVATAAATVSTSFNLKIISFHGCTLTHSLTHFAHSNCYTLALRLISIAKYISFVVNFFFFYIISFYFWFGVPFCAFIHSWCRCCCYHFYIHMNTFFTLFSSVFFSIFFSLVFLVYLIEIVMRTNTLKTDNCKIQHTHTHLPSAHSVFSKYFGRRSRISDEHKTKRKKKRHKIFFFFIIC